MDHTVVHFEIPVEQPERAARFYRDLFGWNITGAGPAGAGGIEYWMVKTVPGKGWPETPGVNGGLMRRMMPGQAIVNYIGVEDVTAFSRKAEQLGAKVLLSKTPVPGMGWFAQLKDTEGNIFAIWQPDTAAA